MPEPNEILDEAAKQIDEKLKKPLEEMLAQLQGKFPLPIGKIVDNAKNDNYEITRMEGGVIYIKCVSDEEAKKIFKILREDLQV